MVGDSRWAALLCCVFCLLISAPRALFAQEVPASGDGVLIVNMDRILAVSESAKLIQEQARALRETMQADLIERREQLRLEEEDLTANRGKLDADAFSARAESFERKVRALRQDSQMRSTQLQRGLFEATEELKSALAPILLKIMEERKGAVMIDARDVMFSARRLDITDEAIKRLDEAAPKIEVKLSEKLVE